MSEWMRMDVMFRPGEVACVSGSRQIGDWPVSHYTFPRKRLFFVEVEGKQYATVEDSLDMAIAVCEEILGARSRRQSLCRPILDFTARIVG